VSTLKGCPTFANGHAWSTSYSKPSTSIDTKLMNDGSIDPPAPSAAAATAAPPPPLATHGVAEVPLTHARREVIEIVVVTHAFPAFVPISAELGVAFAFSRSKEVDWSVPSPSIATTFPSSDPVSARSTSKHLLAPNCPPSYECVGNGSTQTPAVRQRAAAGNGAVSSTGTHEHAERERRASQGASRTIPAEDIF
jgi:hypothetical protein